MKKKSTRFLVLIISLAVLATLAVGALVFAFMKGNIFSFLATDETKTMIAVNTESKVDDVLPASTGDLTETPEITDHVLADPTTAESFTQGSEEDSSSETEEDTTKESKIDWPHEREGVWAAFSHAENDFELDENMTLFADSDHFSKVPLRLFGGQYNRVVFFNDTEKACKIYFNTSVSGTFDERTFELAGGEQKEFRFIVKENITATYALAFSGENIDLCYIPNNGELERVNREFSLAAGTVVYIDGAASGYDIHQLYRLPACEIVWKGNGVTGEFIALNTNATKWNNESIAGKYAVGGVSGVELIRVSILPSENAFVTREICYTQSGNAFKVDIPIDVAQGDTSKTRLNIVANGNIELSGEGKNADGTVDIFKPVICKVTNLKGESHSYQLTAGYESYNVPTVYITTNNGKMVSSKSKYIAGTFSMDASKVPGIESIPQTTMQIKGRGHSTWKKEKKPFAIKFDEKVSILGLPSNRDWILLANYFDPTMSRNYIAYEMARNLSFTFTPSTYPVQVIYNGKYIGMYCIGDKVEIASGRVNQTKHSAAVDRDYLIEVRGYETGYRMGQSAFQAGLLRDVAILNPEPEEISAEQFSYISNYVKQANDAVVNLTNYEDYIDVDSLIDWFIITELTYNCDGAFNRSVFIQKRAGQKLSFQPVWDFDLAFGNIGNLTPDYDSWACSQNGFTDTEITWGTYLIKDPKFRDRLQKRWEEVRGILHTSSEQSLATMYHLMEKAGDANFAKWVVPGVKLGWEWDFVSEYTDYKMHLDYIKNFLNNRFKKLDDVFIDRKPMRIFVDGRLTYETTDTTPLPTQPTVTEVETTIEDPTESTSETMEDNTTEADTTAAETEADATLPDTSTESVDATENDTEVETKVAVTDGPSDQETVTVCDTTSEKAEVSAGDLE